MRVSSVRLGSVCLSCLASLGFLFNASGLRAEPRAASSRGTAHAVNAERESDPNGTRDVTYVVVPEGLKITVTGVKFLASAVAVRVGGGWGAKITVQASAEDGKAHSLTKPKAGPLAFAGAVTRKGKSESEHFSDERSGDGEQLIDPDSSAKFGRTWPMKGVRSLTAGDALDLQVALWGLGDSAETRRPLKQFFHVRLEVGKGKPRAIIEPPSSASRK